MGVEMLEVTFSQAALYNKHGRPRANPLLWGAAWLPPGEWSAHGEGRHPSASLQGHRPLGGLASRKPEPTDPT